jgi:hypothetical protein
VTGGETITATATFRTDQGRWLVSGTDSIIAGQTLTVVLANGTKVGTVIGNPVVDAAGNWAIDLRGATGALDPRTSNATLLKVTSPSGGATVTTIAVRR